MEPRVHHNVLHETAWVHIAWSFNQLQPQTNPVANRVVHAIAKAFCGSEEAGDFARYEGKALAAKKVQNRTCTRDSLGLCDFAHPITYSFNTPDHVGDPELETKIFAAVTGIAGRQLEQYSERIFNQQRVILLREGRRVPEADFLPEYNFTEPLQAIPHFEAITVPGPGDEVISLVGRVLDRDKFSGMLKEYYRLRGWDEETELPRAATLAALALGDLARDDRKWKGRLSISLKVLARLVYPILEPEALYDIEGQVPKVVIPCGNTILKDTLYVYRGDDGMFGVATLNRET